MHTWQNECCDLNCVLEKNIGVITPGSHQWKFLEIRIFLLIKGRFGQLKWNQMQHGYDLYRGTLGTQAHKETPCECESHEMRDARCAADSPTKPSGRTQPDNSLTSSWQQLNWEKINGCCLTTQFVLCYRKQSKIVHSKSI